MEQVKILCEKGVSQPASAVQSVAGVPLSQRKLLEKRNPLPGKNVPSADAKIPWPPNKTLKNITGGCLPRRLTSG